MFDQGRWLYAAGIQNEDGQVIGSMIVCDYPSRDELERLWLNHEPYVVDRVWERIDIHRAEVAQFAHK